MGTIYGADLDQVFIKNSLNIEEDGNMLHLGGSFGELADKYAKCKVSGNIADKIMLNSMVTKIEYNSKDVSVHYINKGVSKQLNTKKVIITVPLGVLKNGNIHFSPSLPEWKSSAIQNLGFGVLDKWIGYWHDDVILPWDLENDVWMELMEDESAQEKIPFKGFFNDYKTNGNHKILTAFVGGDLALDIEKKSDMEIQNLAMTSIQGMFPNTTVPIPNEFKVSRWGQDENFLGAYSFPSKDQMYNSKQLTENIDGKLFFAGEACAGEWYGTASGAYMTGIDAAKEVLNG